MTVITQTLCLRDVTGNAERTTAAAPRCRRGTVADLRDGDSATVLGVCDRAHPEIARRLFDLGFVTGAEITRLRHAPMGDPIVVRVADYEIALRRAQAACITVLGSADGHDDCADCARRQDSCATR